MTGAGGALRLGVLGELMVETDAGQINVGGPKQRAVLTRLIVDAPNAVSAGQLIDDLWAEDPPPSASATLHAYISRGSMAGRSPPQRGWPASQKRGVPPAGWRHRT